MKNADFAHLHVHTTRSLLDGFTHTNDLADVVKSLGQKAVAITDHGNMAAIPSLWKEAKRVGIKPIAGIETYLCDDRLVKSVEKKGDRPYFHMTLLAQNAEGYANLCKLSSLSYTEGFYHKPRIDLAALEEHKNGLIVLSGCIGGWPQQLIINDKEREALKWCQDVNDLMGGRFYLESQETGELDQIIVNETFLAWTKKHKLKHVVTGDSHYTKKEDHLDHDVLLCIGLHKKRDDEDRMKFVPEQYAIKSAQEMGLLGFPESSLKQSAAIAESCAAYELPRAGGFPRREFAYEVLESEATEGLMKRLAPVAEAVESNSMGLGPVVQPVGPTVAVVDENPYWERLNHELKTIKDLGFEDYFLIAHDITGHARSSGMYWTWGRGSSVGSLVAYALGITNIDPVLHHLYFERFLNPSRRNPPDIDIDFTDEDRPEIIKFIEEKYGAENVSSISTYSTLGPRQVLQDLGAVLGKPEAAIQAVIEMLPFDPTAKIDDMLEDLNLVKAVKHYLGDEVLDLMRKFAGVPRHASVHAAGLIIDSEPLAGKLPMMMPRTRPVKASQYVYEDLVGLGFEKFDILGVRTLRTIKETALATGVDLNAIPLDDKKTYAMMSRGLTIGVFQLEGYGYRKFLAEFKPQNFEDVMMVNALYRPGPMKGGRGLGELIARRRGQKTIAYAHPSLEPILKPTFGVMVYQEQVMKVVQTLAGWTLAEADMLRYAVGKKKQELIAELKVKFIKDCQKAGHNKPFAESIFSDIEFFGRYGWNKAHAAAYGMVTYVSAYLKANFPHEYLCAMLNSETSDPKHRQLLVAECTRMGLRVAKPHVNVSSGKYQVIPDARGKHIMAGLSSVKNLGERGVDAILEARRNGNRFSSIEDLRKRVPPRLCNSTAIKFLKMAGAFSDLPETEDKVEVPF